MIVVKEIRKVQGGFIVEVRWPFGREAGGYGEVICKTLDEVIELIKKAAAAE